MLSRSMELGDIMVKLLSIDLMLDSSQHMKAPVRSVPPPDLLRIDSRDPV
jgi:hypothetical protein